MEAKKHFLDQFEENPDFNQYWYSPITIDFLIKEIMTQGKVVAFLSTPSVFFSIKDSEFAKNCFLFEVILISMIKIFKINLILFFMILISPLILTKNTNQSLISYLWMLLL